MTYNELANKINIQRLATDAEWLAKQVQKQRLSVKHIELINVITEKLELIYPNNWDIQINLKERKENNIGINYIGYNYIKTFKELEVDINVIIRFPIIEIQTELNQLHTIRDIYVKFKINYCNESNEVYVSSISGTRTTYTSLEYINNYAHSHLSQNASLSDLTFNKFCLGSGEIVDLIKTINSEFSSMNFAMFLHSIKTYLEWESIEGRPYRRIENMVSKKQIDDIGHPESYIRLVFSVRERSRIDLKWKLTNNVIELIDDENLEKYCKVFDTANQYQTSYICNKDDNGNYYKYDTLSTSLIESNDYPSLIFRGEYHRTKIITTNDEYNNTFYIHPTIKKYIKDELERKANKAILRSYIVRRISNFGYTKEGI